MSAGKDIFGDRPSAGPPQPFFHSRWVPAPAHVRDLGPDVGLPAGFRAAGVACGIKPSGNRDLGLLVCDAEDPVSAARFTASGTPAAPVLVSQERCRLDSLRAILANSGCANAATGKRGLEDAAKTQGAAAIAAGVEESAVVLASTGGISQYLPVERDAEGHPRRQRRAAPRRRRRLPAGDPDDRRVREACLPGGRAVRWPRPPDRAVQGRGDDLAALRDDVLLRPDGRFAGARNRRSAARGHGQALVRPRLRRRPALDERHRRADVLRRFRGQGRARSPRTSCASARRSTRSCASSRS